MKQIIYILFALISIWALIGTVISISKYKSKGSRELLKVMSKIGIFAALYTVLGMPMFSIPVMLKTQLKLSIPIIAFFAVNEEDPAAAFLIGSLGTFIIDTVMGWGFWPHWIMANGLVGMLIAITAKYTKNIWYLAIGMLLANFISFSFAGATDVFIYNSPVGYVQAMVVVPMNAVSCWLALPLIARFKNKK